MSLKVNSTVVTFLLAAIVMAPSMALAVDGWAVFVCKKETEVPKIKLRIGIGGDSNSHTNWTTWTSDKDSTVPVPAKYKNVKEIWVRGEGEPSGRNVHMCVQYNGKTTQKMTFDNGEEHETSQSDNDNCDCN